MHDLLKRNWLSLADDVRARWPELTQEDLVAIDGELEYLVEAVQTRYRIERAEAQAQSEAFVAGLFEPEATYGADPTPGARETLAPGVAKIREGLSELGSGLRMLAGDTVDRGRDASGDLAESAREQAQRLAQRSDEVLERTGRYIRERPFTALGIAFVAGWLLLGRK